MESSCTKIWETSACKKMSLGRGLAYLCEQKSDDLQDKVLPVQRNSKV